MVYDFKSRDFRANDFLVGPVVGDLLVTEAPDAGLIAGEVAGVIAGSLQLTEAPDTGAFLGTIEAVVITGVLAGTEAPDTGLIVAQIAGIIGGVLAATEPADQGQLLGQVQLPPEEVGPPPSFGWAVGPKRRTVGVLEATEAPDTGRILGVVATIGHMGAIDAVDVGAYKGHPSTPVQLVGFEVPDRGQLALDTFDWVAHDNEFLMIAA